jgi:hypothetical protein
VNGWGGVVSRIEPDLPSGYAGTLASLKELVASAQVRAGSGRLTVEPRLAFTRPHDAAEFRQVRGRLKSAAGTESISERDRTTGLSPGDTPAV